MAERKNVGRDYDRTGHSGKGGYRTPEPERRTAGNTGKTSGKSSGKNAGKKQPQRKKAPVKSGSQGFERKQKKTPQTAAGGNRRRYPEGGRAYRTGEQAENYYNPSSSYAGRGQMSYDDFVRNREFFGGEEEVQEMQSQRRRTGGTVKNEPQQGKNNKKNVNGAAAAKNSKASAANKKKPPVKGTVPAGRSKRRSKEIMNERARRKKIKRHAVRSHKTMTPRKRKIKRFLTAFSIFLVIAVVSVMLSLTVFFKTEKIIVTGETRYSQEDIISLSGIQTGENIFLCDKSEASKKIVDALPFVAEANVGFVIPNAITIEIVEEVPSYAIGYSDGYYIIGENGRILEKTAENYDNLPIVQGTEITTNVIGEYADFTDSKITSILNELVKVLDAYSFEDVTVIDVSDTANILFVYDDRITVLIGLPEDISYKVKTAQTIINEKLDPNDTGLIKGRLDVSMCNETKKSYFNENEVYVPSNKQETTEETTAPPETQETAEATEEAQEADETEETQPETEHAETEAVQETEAQA